MDSVFEQFAQANGLSYARGGELPVMSSVLFKQKGVTREIVGGELPGGAEGVVARFELRSRTDQEARPTPLTLMSSRIPEAAGFLPMLICQDTGLRGPLGMLFGPGGLIPVVKQYQFESIKLNRRYRVGIGRRGDENRLRQLFEPAFVDWLAERAPEGCFFELYGGLLSVTRQGEVSDQDELLDICRFGSHVAERIESEARETWDAPAASASLAPTSPGARSHDDELVAQVKFDTPPESVAEAARRYRGVARREGRSWAISGCLSLLAFVVMAVMLSSLAVFVGPWGLAGAVAAGVLFAIYLLAKVLPASFRSRATQLGLRAFLRGYGEQRGLEHRSVTGATLQLAALQLPGRIAVALAGPARAAPGSDLLILSSRNSDKLAVAPGLLVPCPALAETELRVLPGRHEGVVTLGGVTVVGATGVVLGEYDKRSADAVAELFGGRLQDRYTLTGSASGDEERALEPAAAWLADLPSDARAGFTVFRGTALLFGPYGAAQDLDTPRLDEAIDEIAGVSRRLEAASAQVA